MDRDGHKIGHGGDVYYMCPGTNYGKFFCIGVQRALDAGAEAIHLEEPEFWDRAGYSAGFKREWKSYYHWSIGSNYVLQVSTNLLNWSPVSTSSVPVSGTIILTNVS